MTKHNPDTYDCFSELACHETQGRDYHITVWKRNTDISIIAPHGGNIEPGTSEIAKAIAGRQFSVYCFEGIKPANNKILHIRSIHFDEPICLNLVKNSLKVLTIHGCRGNRERLYAGGLDIPFSMEIIKELMQAGFDVASNASRCPGRHPQNICNQCVSGKGVQLEITAALRRKMLADAAWFDRFVHTLQQLLQRFF